MDRQVDITEDKQLVSKVLIVILNLKNMSNNTKIKYRKKIPEEQQQEQHEQLGCNL